MAKSPKKEEDGGREALRAFLSTMLWGSNMKDPSGEEWLSAISKDQGEIGQVVAIYVAKTRSIRFAALREKVKSVVRKDGAHMDLWRTEDLHAR
jgi:hypothetical protein